MASGALRDLSDRSAAYTLAAFTSKAIVAAVDNTRLTPSPHASGVRSGSRARPPKEPCRSHEEPLRDRLQRLAPRPWRTSRDTTRELLQTGFRAGLRD